MRRRLAVARLSHRSAAKGEAWGRECSAGPSLPDMARRIRRDEEEADPAAESFRGPAWQQVGVRRGACCDVLGARCSVPAVPEQYVCTCVCAVRVSTAGPAQRPSRARRAHRRKHILTDARTPCQATHRRRPARRPRQLRGSSAHPAVAEPSRAEPSQAKPSPHPRRHHERHVCSDRSARSCCERQGKWPARGVSGQRCEWCRSGVCQAPRAVPVHRRLHAVAAPWLTRPSLCAGVEQTGGRGWRPVTGDKLCVAPAMVGARLSTAVG